MQSPLTSSSSSSFVSSMHALTRPHVPETPVPPSPLSATQCSTVSQPSVCGTSAALSSLSLPGIPVAAASSTSSSSLESSSSTSSPTGPIPKGSTDGTGPATRIIYKFMSPTSTGITTINYANRDAMQSAMAQEDAEKKRKISTRRAKYIELYGDTKPHFLPVTDQGWEDPGLYELTGSLNTVDPKRIPKSIDQLRVIMQFEPGPPPGWTPKETKVPPKRGGDELAEMDALMSEKLQPVGWLCEQMTRLGIKKGFADKCEFQQGRVAFMASVDDCWFSCIKMYNGHVKTVYEVLKWVTKPDGTVMTLKELRASRPDEKKEEEDGE